MNNPFSLTPRWFNERAVRDEIPWNKSVASTLPKFLAENSLHDSYWCGVMSMPNNSTSLMIQLDVFWTKGKITYSGDQVRDWPVLLIELQRTWHIKQGFFREFDLQETISDANSQLLDEDAKLQLLSTLEREEKWFQEMLFDSPLYKTRIDPIYGGIVEILHGGETRFLLVGADGTNVPIPGL